MHGVSGGVIYVGNDDFEMWINVVARRLYL